MNNKVIIETQYWPAIGWFMLAMANQHIFIDRAEHYNKRTLRNKTHLYQDRIPVVLSIPLQKGKHGGKNIQDIQITYAEDWQVQHKKTIRSMYGKTPFFIHYIDQIEELIHCDATSLFDYNLNMIESVIQLLDMEIEVSFQDEFIKFNDESQQVYREQIKYAGEFTNLEEQLNIALQDCLKDTHIDSDLVSRNSILDVLFQLGPETRLVLKSAIHKAATAL